MSGKMEVWLLDLGTLYASRGKHCLPRPAAGYQPNLPAGHGRAGPPQRRILLFDTGCRPDAMAGGWPANMREAFPLARTSEQALTHQLSLCGISASQIDTVVLSHLHLDHAGNAGLFPHARLIVPAEDFEYARRLTENPDPIRRGGYPAGYAGAAQNRTALSQDRQLFPGIRLLWLPGHTPGLLGMEITVGEKVLLFPSDAVYTAANYGPPGFPPEAPYDRSLLLQSMERIRHLAARPGAQVIFSHDIDLWRQLPTRPSPYQQVKIYIRLIVFKPGMCYTLNCKIM